MSHFQPSQRSPMRRILRREKSGYALGLILCLVGLFLLAVVLWKALSNVSVSQLVLSDLWSYLWSAQLVFPFGIKFSLIYFVILGAMFFFSGIAVLALSQKWFTLPGETVLLTCPYCKNHWRASRGKGWAECPHCRQFVQPQVMKKD